MQITPTGKHLKFVSKMIPHALGAFVIAAHASEFTRVVEHASVWEIVLGTTLLFVWLKTKAPNSEEL